ncbi:MAG: YdeI/OmpD-associated family protein [Chloroflexota bacterium]
MSEKTDKTYEFDAIIQNHEGMQATYVDFPYDVMEEFGVRGRVKVHATFDGIEYRGSLAKMGSPCYFLGMPKEIRDKVGKSAGETVHVIIKQDLAPRVVELPGDVASILGDEKLAEAWAKTSFTHQKEYVNAIKDAKRPETREKRVNLLLDYLRSKLK